MKIVVSICLALLILGLAAWAVTEPGPLTDYLARTFFLPSDGVREARFAVDTRRDASFMTSDGIRLAADVHRPRGLERSPTILVRIPFNNTLVNRQRSDAIGRYWAARGYTVVIQGTRGRYRSSGDFYPAVHERSDGIETLKWIKEQLWYDGRLAMWGGSAFGHTQWAISDQDVDAFFIQISSSDYFHTFHVGGAFALESALYWALVSQPSADRETNPEELSRGADGWPVVEADDRALIDTDFFNDWAMNREPNAYWAEIDGLDRPADVSAPVLLLGGWYDPFLPTMLADFAKLSSRSGEICARTHLIVGPFTHANTVDWPMGVLDVDYRRSSIEPALPWFDHWLGVTDVPLDMPCVRIFVMGENVWRNENEWPLARTVFTSFFLRSDGDAHRLDGSGHLSRAPPERPEAADRYAFDPTNPAPTNGGAMLGPRAGILPQNAVEERNDVLTYETPVLAQAMELTGPIRAVLYVTTDAPSTDFTVKLVDVYPDGTAYNISNGIRRSSFEPRAPTRVEIDVGSTSMVFGVGHRIRLEVSSSNYPLYDRNPNTGESPAIATQTRVANQRVLHTPEFPSHVIFPVIP